MLAQTGTGAWNGRSICHAPTWSFLLGKEGKKKECVECLKRGSLTEVLSW